jgi:hypothetical protein
MSKYRKGKLKLEHHTLEGFDKYIKPVLEIEIVEAVIPGRIFRNNKGRGSKGLFLQYETSSGFKLLYKNGTSVQEVFVVCSDKEIFKSIFENVYKE